LLLFSDIKEEEEWGFLTN